MSGFQIWVVFRWVVWSWVVFRWVWFLDGWFLHIETQQVHPIRCEWFLQKSWKQKLASRGNLAAYWRQHQDGSWCKMLFIPFQCYDVSYIELVPFSTNPYQWVGEWIVLVTGIWTLEPGICDKQSAWVALVTWHRRYATIPTSRPVTWRKKMN